MKTGLESDRYDPDDLIGQFQQQNPELIDGNWTFTLQAKIDEFEVYLPDIDGKCSPYALDLLIDLFRNIRHLDNLVQDSCEEEFRQSAFGLQDFKLHIGWIDLTGTPVRLRYWGTKVNTEWEAHFSRDEDGNWKKVNF